MSITTPKLTKGERALLAELAAEAYNDELTEHLTELYEDFCKWGGDGMSALDLVDRIHDFHDGPCRTLYKRYTTLKPYEFVAQDIAQGALADCAVPKELLDKLGPLIQAFRAVAAS